MYIFEIRPLAKDEMSFEEFISSGRHLVQWSGTTAAILDFRSTHFLLVSIKKSFCCYRASFGSKQTKVFSYLFWGRDVEN